MALAGGIMRYIGNEFVPMATKTASSSLSSVIPSAITKTGASLATNAVTSALGNVTNKAIGNAANKSVEKSVLQNIGGRIFQNGKPKSFYHGSPNPNIDKLDLSKAGSNTQSGENVLYFTDDYPTAEEFSYERLPSNSMFINNRGKKGKVYEKQLDLKNLVDLGNLSDEQIGNLYEYADAINRYDGKEKFVQRVKEDLLAGNDQSIKTRLDLNALKNSDYDGFIAKMYPNQKGLENVREYGVFNPDNVRDVRHIPVEESSSLSSIIPVKRKLYRGQQYSNTDFSYNSELMNENPDKWGSKDVGKGYHFTPKKDMAGSWEGSNGGIIEVDYTPDQVLKADDARKMIEEANKLLADDKYMAKLWQENEALAEQIEKIADGNLEALAKREGKPFVQHLKANDDELGTMYYYKDIDPELTDRFVSKFKQKAEKYMPNNNQQVDEPVMPDNKLSPQQQEFFKDSVVRDENGELIPMYHGSNSNFTVFDKSKGGQSNKSAKVGFWFTPNKEGAEKWAGQSWWGDNEPKVYETYLNIKKPFIYKEVDNSSQIARLEEQLRIAEDEINSASRGSREYYDAYKKYNAIASQIEDLSYTDPYEQFRSHIYAMEGKSPSQANTGGVGMVMDNEDEAVKKYVEMLKNEGYDGIIIKGTSYDRNTMGSKNDQYVVFDPEQIKNVDNLNPTNNPDIRYTKKSGPSLTEMANRIKARRKAQDFDSGIKRIGNSEVAEIDANTLPAGYEKVKKYLGSSDADRIEEYTGANLEKDSIEEYTNKLKKFLEEEDYDSNKTGAELLRDVRAAINEKMANDLNMEGSTLYKDFFQTRGRLQKDNPLAGVGPGSFTISADKDKLYQTDAAKLDAEYSERLGIGRSHVPMSDKALSSDAQGYYMSGGIGINPRYASGESGVSTIAHERMHAWQDINKGEWDSRVGDAIDELRDELKKHYHTKAEIKAYRKSGSDIDYYADHEEQEARMLQSYLDNEGFTKTWRKQAGEPSEWGDEVKPAFDRFYKKFQALSKAGVALPGIAVLFGLSSNGGEKKKKTY